MRPYFRLFALAPKERQSLRFCWHSPEITGAPEVEKEVMSERWEWAGHSDNLVSEILVE